LGCQAPPGWIIGEASGPPGPPVPTPLLRVWKPWTGTDSFH